MNRETPTKTLGLTTLALLAALAAGCDTVTLHPLATDAQRVREPALLGTWVPADAVFDDEPSTLVFWESDATRVEFRYTEDGELGLAGSCALTHLGGRAYLDCWGETCREAEAWSIPVHQIAAVELSSASLDLFLGVPDALRSESVLGTRALEPLETGDWKILTQSTDELRGAILLAQSHPAFYEALGEPMRFVRRAQ